MTLRIRAAAALVGVMAVAGTALAVDAELKKKARDADSFKRSDAAKELARDGSADAARLLAELLVDRSPYVRDQTVVSCAKLTDDGAIAAIAKVARNKDSLARRNAAAALGGTKHASALPALAKLIGSDRDVAVRIAALDALWGYRENGEALELCADAATHADAGVRAAAVEAAGRLRGARGRELTIAGFDDADAGVRAVARMELTYVDPEEASKRLAESADAVTWVERAQCVDDALKLRDVAGVDALVKLLADERVRVSAAAHRGLKELSGKHFGRDTELWASWWKQNRDGWKAPPHRRGGPAEGSDDEKTRARYHGLEVLGDRIAFVVDLSGSMRDPMTKGDDRGPTRWDAARDELSKTIDALPDHVAVNVLLFQVEVSEAFDAPRALDRKTRKSLRTFLKRTTPGERGNLLAGVLAALSQDDVDTLYLLSDGAPSAGDMVYKDRVRDAVRSVNRSRKCAINCVGFGATKARERKFLTDLAQQSGAEVVFK